jgi:hypothetical protein
VHFEASTKPHVHRKFEIFWTNIASTMACPNFKNGPKNGLGPLGIKSYGKIKILGEVWAGWASARTNQHELTLSAQKGRQHEGGLRKALLRVSSPFFLSLLLYLGR